MFLHLSIIERETKLISKHHFYEHNKYYIMTTNNYIRAWGVCESCDTEKMLETMLIERGVKTREELSDLLNLTENKHLRPWDDEIEDYKTELGKIVLKHDRELYYENPTLGDIGHLCFAFDPYSDEQPMAQYDYGSIYEYVDYLETAIETLQPKKCFNIKHRNSYYYHADIRRYAEILEDIAWEHDAYIMGAFEERDWYNPLRRIQQMEMSAAINLLETYLSETYTERQLNKIYNSRISDEAYLLTLTQITHHLQK